MKNLINNIKYKLAFLLILVANVFVFSQFEGGDPAPPEGDGAPASPIDLYLVDLAIVAIVTIFYVHKKSSNLAKN